MKRWGTNQLLASTSIEYAGPYRIGRGDSRHEVSWPLEAVLADDVAVQADSEDKRTIS